MDEEAQKRNTDCVYFLASPLTCKKGNGCEFRHSEAARMNPRDCWYWVHRTCLNPNCAFRHPPLDGKPSSSLPLQTQAAAPAVAMAPTSAAAAAAATPVAPSSNKSKTPCYFFSQGNCAKGEKCPFMHSLSVPTIQEVSTQHKSKSRPNEAEQASSKPVTALKGEAEKHTTVQPSEKRCVVKDEVSSVPLRSLIIPAEEDVKKTTVPEAYVPMQEAPRALKNVRRARIPENLVISLPPPREQVPHGNRNFRITKFSDTPEDYQDAVGRFHDRYSFAETSQQDQPERKKRQFSHLENEHLQRSRALDRRYRTGSTSEAWWKNEGEESDHSNHKEDGEYSPRTGRLRALDDSHRLRVKPSVRNDQTRPSQNFDYGNSHPRQQQMHSLPDYNGSIEHSRHRSFASNAGNSIRNGRRMVAEGKNYNVDLRDQLMKRRRDERGLLTKSESVSRRGDPGDNTHVNQRLWDDNHRQHTQYGRARRADDRGVKRPFHDGEASPHGRSPHISPVRGPQRLGRSPDRASSHDRSRGELRREHYASQMAVTSDARGQRASKKVGSEYAKGDSCFTGPKTLAQIKAEKIALDSNSQIARSQLSTAAGKKERDFGYKSALSTDFEGPKPLSLLKKGKQNVGPVSEKEESRAGPEETGDDLQREVEDGEFRDEEDDWNDVPMQEEVAASRPPLEQKMGVPRKEALSFREADEAQDDDLASSEELSRLEEDLGPIMSGEEDYELDDVDEENFAKNLTSYFS